MKKDIETEEVTENRILQIRGEKVGSVTSFL